MHDIDQVRLVAAGFTINNYHSAYKVDFESLRFTASLHPPPPLLHHRRPDLTSVHKEIRHLSLVHQMLGQMYV